MSYRKQINTTEELGRWYDAKYVEMGDGWHTPAEECNRHLDDLGVPYDTANQTKWLLDIGCGAGHFLAEAEKRCGCLGIEISKVALKYASQRTHCFLEHGSIEDSIGSNALASGKFDYIVSIGSLEHIVNIGAALDNIRRLLSPSGKFYIYAPNENWKHEDQPNERTFTDEEWMTLFQEHGLETRWHKRWGEAQDNTAFCGVSSSYIAMMVGLPHGSKLNCGSGQRPFDKSLGWINIDISDKHHPDLVADWNNLSMFPDNCMDLVVSHHSLEHVGCNEGDGFIREAHRVLKPDGSLLIFVPDMRALAQRYLTKQIDTQIFMTNVYGAYMGDEADRHKWGYDGESLWQYLKGFQLFRDVRAYDWRKTIPGADIAKDWWILGLEAIK